MEFRLFNSRTAFLVLAATFGWRSPLPRSKAAQQSGTVKSTHGAWSIICDTPAGATAEQCALMQNVVAEDRPEIGLSVVVLKTADNKAEDPARAGAARRSCCRTGLA